MEHYRLQDMIKGWFVGDIMPTAFATTACEVAVKNYRQGDHEAAHFHKIATEITLVLHGQVRMCERTWTDGDIVVLAPCTTTDFLALSDACCVVVKVPGALHDKYLADGTAALPHTP